MESFETIKTKLNSENVVYFTDDLINYEKISKMGHNAEEIRQYFCYVNPRLYEIYENAIKNSNQLYENSKNITYYQVPVIEGIKSYFLERLIFLEKIKSILEENKNVVFLFSSLQYFHFAIPLIANRLGFDSNFEICEIKENKFSQLDFNEIFKCNYNDFYENYEEDKTKNEENRPALTLDIKISNPKTGFFLVNNDDFLSIHREKFLVHVYHILELMKLRFFILL